MFRQDLYNKREQLIQKLHDFIKIISDNVSMFHLNQENNTDIQFLIEWVKSYIEKNHPIQLILDILLEFTNKRNYNLY